MPYPNMAQFRSGRPAYAVTQACRNNGPVGLSSNRRGRPKGRPCARTYALPEHGTVPLWAIDRVYAHTQFRTPRRIPRAYAEPESCQARTRLTHAHQNLRVMRLGVRCDRKGRELRGHSGLKNARCGDPRGATTATEPAHTQGTRRSRVVPSSHPADSRAPEPARGAPGSAVPRKRGGVTEGTESC